MENFISWSFFATFAGASAGTVLITQLLKEWVKERLKIPPQLLSYIIAVVLMAGAAFFTRSADTAGDYAIILINALFVALASNGQYDALNSIFGSG